MNYHTPVLLESVIQLIAPTQGKTIIDATLGNAGHTIEILRLGATVLGIDHDYKNLQIATDRIASLGLSDNFIPVLGNFNQIDQITAKHLKAKADGLLLDLGLSSGQQTSQDRGFSFNDLSSLDMRLNPKQQNNTAENIINTYSFDQLYQIFTKLAQERYSKPLILRIIRERQKEPIKNGKRLADIIRKYYQENRIKTKIDPSTKIFLALRIEVNEEFKNIQTVMAKSIDVVSRGGVVCVISFHSGEDRLVKNFIREKNSQGVIATLTPKGITPTSEEILSNPLSRSATLRSYKIN